MAVCREYQGRVDESLAQQSKVPEFPEHLLLKNLHNTWQDTASAVIGTWLGLIYQLTNVDRRKPFMDDGGRKQSSRALISLAVLGP